MDVSFVADQGAVREFLLQGNPGLDRDQGMHPLLEPAQRLVFLEPALGTLAFRGDGILKTDPLSEIAECFSETAE